jgi:hypothetical protein
MRIFNKQAGSVIRNLVRAVIALVTAFGFNLTGDQVAAVMLVTEAVLASGVLLDGRRR